MAVLVLTNAYITVGGTDLSSRANQVTLTYEKDQLEVTAFGDTGHKFNGGLENNSIEITFMQDFSSSTEAALFPLVGTQTTVIVKPNGSVTSGTNPIYTLSNTLLVSHTPVAGAVGELATTSVTFQGGTLTKA